MTHERDGDRHCFTCDSCPDTHEGEPGDEFGDVWGAARAAGLVAFRVDGKFHHRCQACAGVD